MQEPAGTEAADAGRFYTRVLEGYRAERERFEAARGPERYQEGLDHLEMTLRVAATGTLGQFGCIAVKPES